VNKICGIYKITSPTGKIYIGQSVDIKRRYSSYKKSCSKHQIKLCRSIKKYGWNKHIFEIIHKCDKSELNDLEKYYIKLYNTFNSVHGLNLTSGGNNPILSEETKRKIGNAIIGRRASDESKIKMSKASKGRNLGKKLTDEHKEKIRIANTGKKHTEESKIKMRLNRKGIPCSKECKEKLRIINTGKKHTEKQIAKFINSMKGRKCSEEAKQKISLSNMGRKCTEEQKNNMSIAQKKSRLIKK
jgi:hypothetical protein